MNGPEETGQRRNRKKPVKRSAAVYRRRRLAVVSLLLCLLVVCFAVVSALAGFFSGNGAGPEAVGSPAVAETSATAKTAEKPGGGSQGSSGSCDAGKVVVTPHSDATIYPTGQHPRFSVTIENRNPVECDINLGTKAMDYSIRQGGSEVFSSQYCAAGELTDWPRRLAAGAVVEVEDFVWQRTFTQKGCPESSTKPDQALSGNYSLKVWIGNYGSSQLDFALK